MSNLKVPCLSLGARGTLSKAITFTKRRGQNLVEKKPELPYFLTLPVQYQRWLYQDYAYLWTQQSAAVKQVYASNGVRHHLTGFQYWMKHQLTNLPDIVAWWKLDITGDAIARDSSRNNYDATIIGASPAAGLIDGCLSFDGLNDTCTVAHAAALIPTDALTIETDIFTPGVGTGNWPTIAHKRWANTGWILRPNWGTNNWEIGIGAVGGFAWFQIPITTNAWVRLSATYDKDAAPPNLLFYEGGILSSWGNVVGAVLQNTIQLDIGSVGGNFYKGRIDNVRLYNRALDPSEVLRHAQRRYP